MLARHFYLMFNDVFYILGTVGVFAILVGITLLLDKIFPGIDKKLPKKYEELAVALYIFSVVVYFISALVVDAEIRGARYAAFVFFFVPLMIFLLLYNLVLIYYVIREKTKKRRD